MLILGQQLAENAERQPDDRSRSSSRRTSTRPAPTCSTLINDILDLSKIESGTVTVEAEEIAVRRRCASTSSAPSATSPSARACRSTSSSTRRCRAPFTTDAKRLQQILKNLLSNAFKFTAQGQRRRCASSSPTRGWTPDHPVLSRAAAVVAFAVTDTGIGIAPDKQQLIFEAFQQADGGTSRKYGGTGLGLAISRELATLLGGEIRLASVPGQGSTFTLYLPLHYTGPASVRDSAARRHGAVGDAPSRCRVLPVARAKSTSPTTATTSRPGDHVLLIVEDDPHYARILLGLARDKGFKGIVATRGRDRRCRWRGSTSPTRSRSTSSCPTCSAGPCSTT